MESAPQLANGARYYTGALRLAILDLAGTVVDYGSRAPLAAFVELFSRHDVTLNAAEARAFMGRHKRDHIAALCELPGVQEQWTARCQRSPTAAGVEALYQEFIPLQLSILPTYSALIPGTLEALSALRGLGMRIAFTTGYTRDMTECVLRAALEQGLSGDAWVCQSDVERGRPAPWMALECARQLGIFPPAACIKIGDTDVDMQAGRNAGMWCLGVSASGNQVGLSLPEWEALPPAEQAARRAAAAASLHAAGAHAVVDSVADCPPVIAAINARLQAGQAPDASG